MKNNIIKTILMILTFLCYVDLAIAVCGNNVVESGEQCDLGANNGVTCDITTLKPGESCSWCSTSCTYLTYKAALCGDGVLDFLEVCDNGASNGVKCTPESGKTTCTYCSKSCQGTITLNTTPLIDPVCCKFDFSTTAYAPSWGYTYTGEILPLQYAYVVERSQCNTSQELYDTTTYYSYGMKSQEILYSKILEYCEVAPPCSTGWFDFSMWNPRCVYDQKSTNSAVGLNDVGCNIMCEFCGDGIKGLTEECDEGENNGNIPKVGYGEIDTYCTVNTDILGGCKLVQIEGQKCGDGIINGQEECEDSTFEGGLCHTIGMISTESNTNSRVSCSNCQITNNCEKIPGWYVLSEGWGVISGKLVASNTAQIRSDPFDMLIGKDYTLSAKVEDLDSGSKVTIKISSECYSSDGNIKDCGISAQTLEFTSNDQKSQTIRLSTNSNSMNSGAYFRGLKLLIETTGSAKISEISLKDSPTPDVHFDYPLPETSLTGCCPSTYCWDGEVCVDSSLWVDDPMYPPLWNLINISGFVDNHTFEENRSKATGYRCVLDGSGTAIWEPAYIKYDWEFKESGYCSNVTDCFVGYDDLEFDHQYASRGCIPDGEIISDDFVEKTGNHYCYKGNWTTKSYMIALLLQDIAKGDASGDERYTLSCYDDLDIDLSTKIDPTTTTLSFIQGTSFNTLPGEGIDVVSACVMTKPQDIEDQIIAGIVLEESDASNSVASQFLSTIVSEFNAKYTAYTDSSPVSVISSCLESSPVLLKKTDGTDSEFALCVDANLDLEGNSEDVVLKIYYNTKYDYFIISNSQIEELEDSPLLKDIWLAISGFFEDIFTKDVVVESYNSLGYTTSYDRIFILRDNGINVTGLEEQKYDEDERKLVTVLFINYTGTVYSENPINASQLSDLLADDAQNNGNVILKTTYNPTEDAPQEIYIKSESTINEDSRTGIWPYFTTILRIDGSTLKE